MKHSFAMAHALKKKMMRGGDAAMETGMLGDKHMSEHGHEEMMARGGYSGKAEKFIGKEMHKYGEGKLHSGSKHGPEVTNPKQAVAIAMSQARKKGMKVPHEAEGGEAKSKRERAMEAFKQGMHEFRKGQEAMPKMAEGGEIEHFPSEMGYQSKDEPDVDGDLMPEAHLMAEEESGYMEHPESHQSSAPHEEMNQMGEEDEGAGDMNSIHPMVRKIMMGRAKGYSEGGKVANEDSGESASEPVMAKWDENEFDDLGKRGGMDGEYSGSMEHGDAEEDREREDIISRVMKSRAKRDRMAVPGEGSTYGKGR